MLLDEHWEAVEADLLRCYGVDLAGLLRGDLSLRRVRALVRGLPPGSALARGIDARAEWTVTDWLLAAVVDHVAVANWQRANHGAKHPNPAPRPVPRPGAAPQVRAPAPGVIARLRARTGRS